MTYYKATRPDGTSFNGGAVRWEVGEVTLHPGPVPDSADAADYLSVSTSPTDCTGMKWPCRLFEVEPVDGYPVWTSHPDSLPNKRAAGAWRVVRELPAHDAFGPQSEHVAALIERAGSLTADEARGLGRAAAGYAARGAARGAAWGAAWDAARYAAWYAAWDAVWDAARGAAWWYAAGGAAGALAVRDLISSEHYDTLTRPWRVVIGPIHPDDKELSA